MIDRPLLKQYAADFGITLTDAQTEKLDIYAALLAEWSQKMNLTAIKAPEEVLVKHFLDSLTVATVLPAGPIKMIDVGTGAGFPGVPLAILHDDIDLTLLDSLNKRLIFLEAVCRETGVTAKRVHARAEDAAKLLGSYYESYVSNYGPNYTNAYVNSTICFNAVVNNATVVE